jgi:poly(A) polymerase Pap1
MHFQLDADIDTLCVFPKYVSRKDFFTIMLSLLRSNEQIKDITVNINPRFILITSLLFLIHS